MNLLNLAAHDGLQSGPANAPGCRATPAEVILVEGEKVTLSLGVQQFDATVAVLGYHPGVGDRVLALLDEASGCYVIGVLSTATPRVEPVSIDPVTGTTTVRATGDLELVTPNGGVRIVAATGVDAAATGPIDLRSHTAVRMSVVSRLKQAVSRIGLIGRKAEIGGDRVGVESDELRIASRRAHVDADEIDASSRRARLSAERLDAALGVVTSTAEEVYQKVSGLWQVAAERTRMVVRGASHHSAKRVHTKAEDVKVKADKIHLG